MADAPLVVVSGPSGVGKSTVVAEALRLDPGIWLSVSATTRSPRPGEVDGR
jgi:guanylate kinase